MYFSRAVIILICSVKKKIEKQLNILSADGHVYTLVSRVGVSLYNINNSTAIHLLRVNKFIHASWIQFVFICCSQII